MRDPVIYRIKPMKHPISGDFWHIYPMYDYAHCISDALEKITHSLCTLEFQDHRPLYDWILQKLDFVNPPRQIEFSRLNLTYTIMSKRFLKRLVDEKIVEGWDDPRMPTIQGIRRRGYPASALRLMADRVGISKVDSTIDVDVLENAARDVLNESAPRAFAVLDPLEIEISNLLDDHHESLVAPLFPQRGEGGPTRTLTFGKKIWIERSDFYGSRR